MAGSHHIEIRRLRVIARIGVPDEERAAPQELRVSLSLSLATPFAEMADDLAKTVDYAELASRVQALAAERPRRLIETLAADIAGRALEDPRVRSVEVVVEKFILPDTDAVAVRLRRGRESI
jgi:dihydroneopterin aldolase